MSILRTISLASAAALVAAGAGAQTPVARMEPCSIPGLQLAARCGTVQVPENREQPGGRMLDLYVVVVPARSGQPTRQAVAFFGGGPGQSATGFASHMPNAFAGMHGDRDFLFIDQRGTGRSASLACSLRDPTDPQTYLDDFLPPARTAACRDSLARIADLSRYTTPDFAHDVEAVRVALRYGPLDLWGGSAGTRSAQVYMRMYPGSVRSVVMQGLVPPGQVSPAHFAQDTERALDHVARACREDPACAAAFPDPVGEVRAVAARLESQPAEAEIFDGQTGRRVRLTLTRGTFTETIRKMMYDPGMASTVPFMVHRAYHGDFRPVARFALSDRRQSAQGSSWGLYLAVTCTEDVPFVDQAVAARDEGTTLLGTYRVRQQTAACEGWPRGTLPADYHELVRSDIPVLLVSGEFDPVTPPSAAERTAQAFPNHTHVVVPGGGHGLGGMQGVECVDSLVVRFVRQGNGRGLDTSCLARIRRPPFVMDIPEPITLQRAALDRLAGTYASPDLEVRLEVMEGGALHVIASDFEAVALPVSSTRFILEGWPPGFDLEFAPDAASVTMHLPAQPDIVMPRKP